MKIALITLSDAGARIAERLAEKLRSGEEETGRSG